MFALFDLGIRCHSFSNCYLQVDPSSIFGEKGEFNGIDTEVRE